LHDFDIGNNWIKKEPINNKEFDSLKYVYKVYIPSDLSAAELIQHINFNFIETQSFFVAEEIKNYGQSSIKIYSENKLKLQAFIQTDKKLVRECAKISMIVDGTKNIEDQELNKILS